MARDGLPVRASGMSVPGSEVPAEILDPKGRALYLRVEDDGEQYLVHPRWLPTWFVGACLGIPLVAFIGATIWSAFWDGLGPWVLIVIPFSIVAAVGSWLLLREIARKSLSKGQYCRLDRNRRVLRLSRLGIDLREGEVIGFVLVSATVVERDDEGASWERLQELSVLARTDSSQVVRHPVVTCGHRAAAIRVGRVLADFFHVDLQFLRAARTQETNTHGDFPWSAFLSY